LTKKKEEPKFLEEQIRDYYPCDVEPRGRRKMKTFKKFVSEETLDEATFQTTIATLNQDIPTGNYSDPRVVTGA
jgi:hypothetical protein